MTLKQIEARQGSFSIAVTQSSLSQRIVELEEAVGAPRRHRRNGGRRRAGG